MESPHYFLKTLGLESYMSHEPLPRVDMDNFELDSKIKTEHTKSNESVKDICEKQDVISEEVRQITADIEADDFFSSLELLSSSKMSSNMLGLGFSNKLTGGIVTRSRSLPITFQDVPKVPRKAVSHSVKKGTAKQETKKKGSGKLGFKKKVKTKKKGRKLDGGKKTVLEEKDKVPMLADSKKQCSNKLDENILEKNLGLEKSKDDDDWILFNNLGSRNEVDDKIFESKQILSNELPKPAKKSIPDLFPINSISMNDGMPEEKDEEVDNFLEVEDYEDNFLEEMEDFNYAPPRSHTGGKWKPGSLTVRTSPMLWQNENWDGFFDEKHQDEEKRNRAGTPDDSPTESLNKFSVGSSGKSRSFAPPSSHTGGKWKPTTPPATHTGGKWKPVTPPATHTGGKWKPSDPVNRSKKLDRDLVSLAENDQNWKYETEREMDPPPTYTGGKWKPIASHGSELWKIDATSKPEAEVPSFENSSEKWGSESEEGRSRSTLDVLAKCQSMSGKCLKTSGGMIQYYCFPCNRKLSSKKMYKKHIQSELHVKRFLQENELEFDSRSIKYFRGFFGPTSNRERSLGKRVIKKPETLKNTELDNFKKRKIPPLIRITGRRVIRREIICCEVCQVKIPSHQLGKHLVSYYHSRRIQLSDPKQQKMILDNIHAIVKQAPYQCGICKFYCNTHTLFKKHWALCVHNEVEALKNHRFWCSLCNFECDTSRSMELHLDSNSHREVILTVNKSIPIIIRHKLILKCDICSKEFRFNRELIQHKRSSHEIEDSDKCNKFVCSMCQKSCSNVKSLQKHILKCHKGKIKIPYFCSTCNEFFNTAAEAKSHRNSQFHKHKKKIAEGADPDKLTLSKICSYCEMKLENLATLKSHLLENHFEFLPKCINCGKVFALSQEVSQHVKNNKCDFSEIPSQFSSSEMFKCENCPYSTSTKSEFLLHVAIHKKKSKQTQKIPCPLCKSCFTPTSLSIHLKTHLKDKTFQCSVCSKTFVRRDRYLKHIKARHKTKEIVGAANVSNIRNEERKSEKHKRRKKKEKNESEKNKNTKDEESKVKDKIENEKKQKIKSTLGSSAVESPKIKKSTEETLLEKKICGDAKCKYVPKDSEDLEKHTTFHVGFQHYQCTECPYKSKTYTIIKRHFLIHADVRSFPCDLCSFKARLKSHLKRHMRLHTGAKPYKCPHCPYTCNILENLRKHVLSTKIHQGKNLYECKLCDFSTNVSKDFKMHLSINHADAYKASEVNEMAGIYSKSDDRKNDFVIWLKKRGKPSAEKSPKKLSALSKKKKEIYYKFCPIAPKPPLTTESLNSGASDKTKSTNHSQISGKKIPRSYPSPAEKDLKTKLQRNDDVTDGKINLQRSSSSKVSVTTQTNKSEEGDYYLYVIPSEEPAVVQSTEPQPIPSYIILNGNELPSTGVEHYLEKYQASNPSVEVLSI